jgi:NAD(P)H-dependent FMN reductase
MQISKNFFVICALALLVSAPPLRAAESEAQAKAREALRKKMSELDAQEKGAPAPAPRAPAPTAPAATPPAGVAPAGPGPAAAPAPSRVDDETTARARDATRQKLRELNAQQFPGSTPAPSAQVAPPQTPPPTVPAAVPVTAVPRLAGDDEATARAREAMRQKLRELDTQQFPGPASAPSAPPAGQMADTEATERARAALRQKIAELDAQQPSAASRPELKPLPAPPSPFSGPKEARLADLLRQYKADEISPEQYHKQRAKILTEP